jgi:hypothetical protein
VLSTVPLLVVEAVKLSGLAARSARWTSVREAEAAEPHERLHPGD